MPWNKVTQMDEMIRFVTLAQTDRFTITDLCEQFGISRKTGYKHLDRYAEAGLKGLQPRSHRPRESPQRTDEAIEALIVAERKRHRTWGPKKLHKVLQVKHGIEAPPARSTIGEILRRHGLSVRRRRKPGAYPAGNDGLTIPTQPNHVWTVDFKEPSGTRHVLTLDNVDGALASGMTCVRGDHRAARKPSRFRKSQ